MKTSIKATIAKELVLSRVTLIRARERFTIVCIDHEKAMDRAERLYWESDEEKDIYVRYMDEDSNEWVEELMYEAA